MFVGTSLRCEPTNEYDANAVRVEVMGQLFGYVARLRLLDSVPRSTERVAASWKRTG